MLLAPLTSILLSFITTLLAMAFYTLMERKFLGYFQLRKGPNKPGLMGLPQPFADAIKLFIKQISSPSTANRLMFIISPATSLTLALIVWTLYPHPFQPFFIQFGLIFFLCVSSMNVYATFLSGWCSNSKYALLGALRAIAQSISYEVSMALILITTSMLFSTFNLLKIHMWACPLMLSCLPLLLMWFITALAETSRTPFDFAEGESELVSGFNIEFSAGLFALIFMAEYTSILGLSLITATLFMPTNSGLMTINSLMIPLTTLLLATLFVWVRATLPRMRYDNLMYLAWKSFLPLTLSSLLMISPLLMTWHCAGLNG